jgi:hypothetical protein
MKKLSVAIVSLALCVNSFADGYHHHHGGGENEWVAPLIIGGVIGAVVANNMKQGDSRQQDYQRQEYYSSENPRDCRTNPRPCTWYNTQSPVILPPSYPNSFPVGNIPPGYHFEQDYFPNCNCYKWIVARD